MEQVVSFVADRPGPPPLSPEARIALKLICGVLALPSVAAAAYVAFMNVGFLSGSAATPVGQLAGVFGGIIAALGLFMLLIAVGLTRQEQPAVAVMALVLFVLCLAISLAAMSGFSMASSQPMKIAHNHETRHRPLQEIRRDLANAANRCIYEGIPYHCDWQLRLSREIANAHREDETPQTPISEPTEYEVPGTGMIVTASAKKFGNMLSAWGSHLIIVAFASVGMAITLASAHELMKQLSPALPLPLPMPPSAAPGPRNHMEIMEEGFNSWVQACVGKQDGAEPLRASDVYSHYAQWCARALHLKDGDILSDNTFGAMMRSVATSVGKSNTMRYGGIMITDSLGIWNEIEKMRERDGGI